MVYVLAFEEDGYVRDVTQRYAPLLTNISSYFHVPFVRYAREFNTKTSKLRLGGKGKKEWWEAVMFLLSRPYRLVSFLHSTELPSDFVF